MDLPTCPACGQSVLDDDPQICPFCGASMTAKKGAKPTAPSGKSSPQKSVPKKSTQKKKDIDPFAIEASTHKAAARVALRPAKGRTHPVKCPMCETEGFIPESAAGKLVKCANPSCMVPVFEAPEIVVEEPESEPKKKTSPLMIVVLLLVIGGGGFGIYKTMFSGPNNKPLPRSNEQLGGTDFSGQSSDPKKKNPETNEPDEPKVPKVDLAAFRKTMIERTMLDIATSRERNGKRNRSRQFCRQQISEAYARIGQIDNAIDQLDDIDKSNPDLYFQERLPALIQIGWQQLAAGDQTALAETLAQAEKAGAETTHVSRPRLDRFSSLAALFAASGDLQKAELWTQRATNASNITDRGEFERLRQASSQITPFNELPDYKFTTAIDNPLQKRQSPEAVTVALILAGRGFDQVAVEWMKSLDVRACSDSLLAYINWKASRDESSPEKLEQLIADQPAVVQVRILSAASTRLREKGNAAVADDFLSRATAKADDVLKDSELLLPAPHQILNFKLPEPEPRLHAALALWELAQAKSAASQNDAAWETLQQALALCRSIAPSPAALAARPHRDSDSGADQVKQALAKQLDLSNNNEIRIQFNNYTTKLNQLESAAARRMLWVDALLDTAVDWGLEEQVGEEIVSRLDQTDIDRKESMIQAPLMGRVRRKLEQQNKTKSLEQINSRLGTRVPHIDAQAEFMESLDQMIASGKFDGMAEAAQTAQIDRNRIELGVLDRMQKLLDQGKVDLCVSMIESLPDLVPRTSDSGLRINDQLLLDREELYYFLGRRAAAMGKGTELAASFQKIYPTPTEEISLLAGIAVGLKIPAAKTVTEPTESAETSSGED